MARTVRPVACDRPPLTAVEPLLLRALDRAGTPAAAITALDWEPMDGGYSTAHLWRAHVAVRSPGCAAAWGSRLVVKRIRPLGGWLGWASEDARVREVQLWRAGILDRLPPGVASAVLAGEEQSGPGGSVLGGTLVMRDVSAHLVQRTYGPAPHDASLLELLLDALARLHAAFWDDATLLDPCLGLMSPRAALGFAAPDTLARRLAVGDADPYLRGMPAAWDTFLASVEPAARAALRAALADRGRTETILRAVPFTLVHGDAWGPNFAVRPATGPAHPAREVVLLDWGLACAAPCTFDPLWLCATWPTLDAPAVLARYRARLTVRLRRRGVRLTGTAWQRLLDLGYLRTVLAGGEAFGRALQRARNEPERRRAQAVAEWWAGRAARAAGRLLND